MTNTMNAVVTNPITTRKNMSMIAPSLDSASHWLTWSNVLYVGGAAITVATAMFILWENRAIAAGKRVKYYLLSEFAVALAAIVSLIGTIGAIHFSDTVSRIKDADLATYETSAKIQIAEANKEAAQAKAASAVALEHAGNASQKAEEAQARSEQSNATAEESRLDKEKILHDNLLLQRQVEEERAGRLQIEQRLAPRSLKGGAQAIAISQLRRVGPVTVEVIVYPGNVEATNVAEQIIAVFRQLKWVVEIAQPLGGSYKGIKLRYLPTDRAATEVASVISQMLKSSDLSCDVIPSLPPLMNDIGAFQSDGTAGTGKVRIAVGSK